MVCVRRRVSVRQIKTVSCKVMVRSEMRRMGDPPRPSLQREGGGMPITMVSWVSIRWTVVWRVLSRAWCWVSLVRVAGDLQEGRRTAMRNRRRMAVGIRYFASFIGVLLSGCAGGTSRQSRGVPACCPLPCPLAASEAGEFATEEQMNSKC